MCKRQEGGGPWWAKCGEDRIGAGRLSLMLLASDPARISWLRRLRSRKNRPIRRWIVSDSRRDVCQRRARLGRRRSRRDLAHGRRRPSRLEDAALGVDCPLSAVEFIDARHGWAVGGSTRPFSPSREAGSRRTTAASTGAVDRNLMLPACGISNYFDSEAWLGDSGLEFPVSNRCLHHRKWRPKFKRLSVTPPKSPTAAMPWRVRAG